MSEDIGIGVYENISFEDYCKLDAVNNSSLKQMDISPAHCKASLDGKETLDSDAMRFGRLIHCGQLEPEHLDSRYVVMPDYHLMPDNVTAEGKPSKAKTTKFYKECVEGFEKAENDIGREIVTSKVYGQMEKALEVIKANPVADTLLNQEGRTELTIVWDCEFTGVRCKARLDKHAEALGAIADLKTCANPQWFNWELWKYNYHKQAAFYREGWRVATGEEVPFWLVIIGPRDQLDLLTCLAAPVSAELLDVGFTANLEALGKVAYCQERDEWPNIEQPDEWTGPDHKVQAALDREEVFNG